jgi:ADP-ribose pyrophosphatase YjhB (NUDIX family)
VAWRVKKGGQPAILLISARKYPGSWTFPVGTVEAGETSEGAAARECREESGYIVDIGPAVGTIRRARKKRMYHYTFFLARVTDEVKQYETDRQRKWVPQNEVSAAVAKIFRPIAKAVMSMQLCHKSVL